MTARAAMTASVSAARIELDELSAELRALAERMARVGAALRYYGGFGPFAEYGATLQEDSAPLCRELAVVLERMRGAGHA